jgi:hypothetical protein
VYWPNLWLVFGSRALLLSDTAVAGIRGAGAEPTSAALEELRLAFGVMEMESSSKSSLSITADMLGEGMGATGVEVRGAGNTAWRSRQYGSG